MKNEFYKYVKEKIKSIPCSGYFDLSNNHMMLEKDFLLHINKEYIVTLINFQQKSKYYYFPLSVKKEQIITDIITYYFKVNNQMYFEYKSTNKNTTKSDKYHIINMIAYSSESNHKELILFLEYISNYIKINK